MATSDVAVREFKNKARAVRSILASHGHQPLQGQRDVTGPGHFHGHFSPTAPSESQGNDF